MLHFVTSPSKWCLTMRSVLACASAAGHRSTSRHGRFLIVSTGRPFRVFVVFAPTSSSILTLRSSFIASQILGCEAYPPARYLFAPCNFSRNSTLVSCPWRCVMMARCKQSRIRTQGCRTSLRFGVLRADPLMWFSTLFGPRIRRCPFAICARICDRRAPNVRIIRFEHGKLRHGADMLWMTTMM